NAEYIFILGTANIQHNVSNCRSSTYSRQRSRLGDVVGIWKTSDPNCCPMYNKKFIVYTVAWRYSSAGTEAE
ncbi:MAG: hypothetical protein ABIX01_10595, partial [Chitinophagaceae bacterium]